MSIITQAGQKEIRQRNLLLRSKLLREFAGMSPLIQFIQPALKRALVPRCLHIGSEVRKDQ